jgi:hypothetical protein
MILSLISPFCCAAVYTHTSACLFFLCLLACTNLWVPIVNFATKSGVGATVIVNAIDGMIALARTKNAKAMMSQNRFVRTAMLQARRIAVSATQC